MNVLTLDNTVFNIDQVPDTVDDVRYCVLEYSDAERTDFYFKSLLFLESFNDSKIVLRVGENTIELPQEWSIICGDIHSGDLELINISALNERDFDVLVYNPLTKFRLDFQPISSVGFYQDVRWYSPRLGLGQILAVPLDNSVDPMCVFVTHCQHNKVPEVLNIEWLL